MKEKTLTRIRKFTEDRNWDQFHSPANLAKSISIEASELLECFQWNEENFDLQHVKEELADVIIYSQDLLDKLNFDVDEIVALGKAKFVSNRINCTGKATINSLIDNVIELYKMNFDIK